MTVTVSTAASGLVLAGGEARRMGQDKRGVAVDGRPLLALAVEAVTCVCSEVLVVASSRQPRTRTHGAREVHDRRPGAGPLAGIEAGLLSARHEHALVLAGDHPGARRDVLSDLLTRLQATAGVDAVVLGTDRGPQPLVAAYRRRVHQVATDLLDRGERRARALLEHLEVVVVDESDWRALDPSGRTAVDLDTPEDVAAWERTR